MTLDTEIRRFLNENFIFQSGETLLGDESLTQTGVLDSMGVLELVLFLEEQYNFKVLDEETLPENLDTVDNIVRYVQMKLGGTVEAEVYDHHGAAA